MLLALTVPWEGIRILKQLTLAKPSSESRDLLSSSTYTTWVHLRTDIERSDMQGEIASFEIITWTEDNGFTYIINTALSHTWSYQFLLPSLWINSLSLGLWFGNCGKDWLFVWQKHAFFLKEAGNSKRHSFVSDVSDERDPKEPDFRAWGGAIARHSTYPCAFPLISGICG